MEPVTARQVLDHIDFLDAGIAAVGEQVTQRMGPFSAAVGLLVEVPGLSQRSAEVAIAETGYFGAQYAQIARRRGPNKAAVAVAHSLTDVIWHLLTTGERFNDLGADYFEHRRDPAREARRLVNRLEDLGHTVTLTPTS